MNPNKHITEYLDNFISIPKPDYAMMINGSWGSGKTWFIDNYIEDRTQHHGKLIDSEKIKFVKVSLFGLKDISEISTEIFFKSYKRLNKKGIRKGLSVVSKMIKLGLKIDAFGSSSPDFSFDIGLPKSIEGLLDSYGSSKKVFVFDDLERTTIPLVEVLGFFSKLIEEGENVIIIAHDTEFPKENKETFDKFKEKVVGKSFVLTPDVDGAYEAFKDRFKDEEAYYNFLCEYKTSIINSYYESKYDNLRLLYQSIIDFYSFFKRIPDSKSVKKEAIEHITSLFFALSIELKKGSIDVSDVEWYFHFDLTSFLQDKTEKKDNPVNEVRRKYNILKTGYNHPISYVIIKNFFTKGVSVFEEIESCIKNSSYYLDENTPSYIKLKYYNELEDKKFISLVEETWDMLSCEKINDPEQLLAIVSILLFLENLNLVSYTSEEITNKATVALDEMKTKKASFFTALKQKSFSSNRSEYDKNVMAKVQLIKSKIDGIRISIKEGVLRQNSNDLLTKFNNDYIDEFYKIFVITGNQEASHNSPVLAYLDEKLFIDKLFQLKNSHLSHFARNLPERYQYEEFNKNLQKEHDWLTNVKKLIEQKHIDPKEAPILHYNINSLMIPSINECISILSGSIYKNNTIR